MILGDVVKAGLQVILILVVLYILLFAVEGFGTLAPGDYPWEDVYPRPLSDVFYYFADAFEMWRDVLAY